MMGWFYSRLIGFTPLGSPPISSFLSKYFLWASFHIPPVGGKVNEANKKKKSRASSRRYVSPGEGGSPSHKTNFVPHNTCMCWGSKYRSCWAAYGGGAPARLLSLVVPLWGNSLLRFLLHFACRLLRCHNFFFFFLSKNDGCSATSPLLRGFYFFGRQFSPDTSTTARSIWRKHCI